MFRIISIRSHAFKLAIADGAIDVSAEDLDRCAEKLKEMLAELPDDDIVAMRDALLLLRTVHGFGVRLDEVGAERVFHLAEAVRPDAHPPPHRSSLAEVNDLDGCPQTSLPSSPPGRRTGPSLIRERSRLTVRLEPGIRGRPFADKRR